MLPVLRKCAALINRDQGSGVIVQRIIGSDPQILTHLGWIFSSIWLDKDIKVAPRLPEVIELFGWPIVREIALVILLHEFHTEAAYKIAMRAEDLDRRALAILAGTSELGGSSFAGLFANIGEVAIGIHDVSHGSQLKKQFFTTSDERVNAERGAFGFDHAVLGSFMLSAVDFPVDVCDEVFEHTTVGTPIWIAEHLADDLGQGLHPERAGIAHPIWEKLGFSGGRLERLRASIESSGNLPYLAFGETSFQVA
jgi:hypothetical protein